MDFDCARQVTWSLGADGNPTDQVTWSAAVDLDGADQVTWSRRSNFWTGRQVSSRFRTVSDRPKQVSADRGMDSEMAREHRLASTEFHCSGSREALRCVVDSTRGSCGAQLDPIQPPVL